MGCNCATQEQIKKLHELYGQQVKPGTPTTLKFKITKLINTIGVYIVLTLLFPFLIGFIAYNVIIKKNNKISIRKIMGYRGKNTLDVAIAQNIIDKTNIAKINE